MRTLIIYYTRSGNTGLAAHIIKRELKAHIREITDFTKNRTLLDYMFTSLIDSASISPTKLDIDYYETIFIGTPVWFGSIAPAIKKLIDNMDFKNKNIILFNTMKGIGGDIAMKRMARLVRKHNGNVIGAFSIITRGDDYDIMDNTRAAIKDLNLKIGN
ncbi:flavodoxin [Methanosphaera sp. ISO3-F5]|uniref:flavodoxin family protein n=1 Tax=Methanosphaera sp. ISO3-F5 TaxID=1452353 RepID=UPI002B25CA6B|nr:flavodoxin [Methanosphaera sp. ISO3-F5]WQH63387.1 flavodoxin [Methanosphaera sp. ISO3-F5]